MIFFIRFWLIWAIFFSLQSAAAATEKVGTAFAVSDGYHIVTAAHVVSEKSCVFVGSPLWNSQEQGRVSHIVWQSATLVALREIEDIALIRVENALPPLAVGDWRDEGIGSDILVVGFPLSDELGTSPKAAAGIISGGAVDPRMESLFQIDVTVMPGHSGSPVITSNGTVIGLVKGRFRTKGSSNIGRVSFAVSGAAIEALLASHDLPAAQTVLENGMQKSDIYTESVNSVVLVFAGNEKAFTKRFGSAPPHTCAAV